MNERDKNELLKEFDEIDTEFDEEHFFTCPYCWQAISMVLDLSVAEQTYIEDCEVCCRPITIFYTAQDYELQDFSADITE